MKEYLHNTENKWLIHLKMVKQLNDTFSYYSDSYSTMETLPLISSDMSNMTLLQIARGNEKGAGGLGRGCGCGVVCCGVGVRRGEHKYGNRQAPFSDQKR